MDYAVPEATTIHAEKGYNIGHLKKAHLPFFINIHLAKPFILQMYFLSWPPVSISEGRKYN